MPTVCSFLSPASFEWPICVWGHARTTPLFSGRALGLAAQLSLEQSASPHETSSHGGSSPWSLLLGTFLLSLPFIPPLAHSQIYTLAHPGSPSHSPIFALSHSQAHIWGLSSLSGSFMLKNEREIRKKKAGSLPAV